MVELLIKGMHCAGCVNTIERAVSQVPNVKSVRVNLSEESAKIEGSVSIESLIDAISKTGYEAKEKLIDIPKENHSKGLTLSVLKQLLPLVLIFFYITIATLLMNRDELTISGFMYDFMGLFYIVFSFFKFLDYKNFPRTFAMYDPIAKIIPVSYTHLTLPTILRV